MLVFLFLLASLFLLLRQGIDLLVYNFGCDSLIHSSLLGCLLLCRLKVIDASSKQLKLLLLTGAAAATSRASASVRLSFIRELLLLSERLALAESLLLLLT